MVIITVTETQKTPSVTNILQQNSLYYVTTVYHGKIQNK